MKIEAKDYESEKTRKILADAMHESCPERCRESYGRIAGMLEQVGSAEKDRFGAVYDVQALEKMMMAKKQFDDYARQESKENEAVMYMVKDIESRVADFTGGQAEAMAKIVCFERDSAKIDTAIRKTEENTRKLLDEGKIKLEELAEIGERYFRIACLLDI